MTQKARVVSERVAKMTTDEIDEAVKKRRVQIRTIVAFVKEVSTKIGKMISSRESSLYTHSVWEVQFGEFKWQWDAGLGLGLDRVTLWLRSSNPVLVVEYFTTRDEEERYDVKTFSSLPGWFDEFAAAVERKDEIIREMEKEAQTNAKLKREKEEQKGLEEKRRNSLLEEAARLGL